MKSREYWENRALANHAKALKRADNGIKELKKLMGLNLKDVKKQIKEFYGKYGDDTAVQLTLFELKKYKKDLKAACERYPKSRKLKQIYKQDYPKYKIDRLRAFEVQLQTNLAYITSRQEKQIATTLRDVAGYSSGLTAAMLSEGLKLDFNTLNTRILSKIIEQNWAGGGNWSSRIWRDCDNCAKKITDVLSRGLPQGESLQRLSRELSKATETSFNDAFRLVRTESAHIINQSNLDSFKEAQEELGEKLQYEYSAHLDNRTSEICEEMNGKVFYLDEAVEGENYPPLHPNCRSCAVPVI